MQACQMVKQDFGAKIEKKADIVIATAGGYPKDINLYQSQKTIDNASYAMKPGGVSIILAQCPLIQDPPEFFDWFQYEDLYSMEKAARDNFLISGWLAIKQLEYKEMGTIILVTEPENFDFARKAHQPGKNCSNVKVGGQCQRDQRDCARQSSAENILRPGGSDSATARAVQIPTPSSVRMGLPKPITSVRITRRCTVTIAPPDCHSRPG